MNCYLLGSKSLTIECASLLLDRRHTIEGVVTSSDQVREWAESRAIAVIPDGADLVPTLAAKPFDLLLSVAHQPIIPDELLGLPRVAAINFHDGPLPSYAGVNVPAWALMSLAGC